MKSFHSKYFNKEYPLVIYFYTLLLCVGAVILFNIFSIRNIWINVSLISIFIAYTFFDYFTGTYVDEVIIEDSNKTIVIKSKRKNGKDTKPEKFYLMDINFIYEFENLSRSGTAPVLKIYKDKLQVVKLFSESNWEKEVIFNLIEEMKNAGVKGKVSKSEKSFSDEFDYYNW